MCPRLTTQGVAADHSIVADGVSRQVHVSIRRFLLFVTPAAMSGICGLPFRRGRRMFSSARGPKPTWLIRFWTAVMLLYLMIT